LLKSVLSSAVEHVINYLTSNWSGNGREERRKEKKEKKE